MIKQDIRKILLATVSGVGLVSVCSVSVSAQNNEGGLELEEITVTAERSGFGTDVVQAGSFRGARVMDTPLTVSVISRDMIETQQAEGLLDALKNTAGVTSAQIATTTYSNLAIRGIDVENRGNYRLNGALPIINLIDLPLEDKVRVEALKGASALYYGFSAPSGIINLVMKRPTEEQYMAAKVSGSSRGAFTGHLDYGNTWGDGVFGARVNLVYGRVDSGIDNTSGKRFLASGAFDFKPTDNLTFSLDAERIYKTAGEPGVYRLTTKPQPTVDDPTPQVELPVFRDPTLNFGPGDWADYISGETNVLLAAKWKINPAWELSASAGTSRHSRDRNFNYIDFGNPLPDDMYNLNVGKAAGARHVNKNIRTELAGTFETGIVVHNVLFGAGQNVRDRYNSSTVNNAAPDSPCTSRGTLFYQQSLTNPVEFPSVPFCAPNYGTNNSRNSKINDIGYYVFDRISFGEIVDVLAGARRSDYTESALQTGEVKFSTKVWSFSGGLVVKPTDWVSVYGTYIEGLETTAGAPLTANNAGEDLPPTDSTQYELGVKIQPHKGLLFQAAYFDIKRGSAYVNAANFYVLDGSERYRGGEISLSGEVTDQLSIYASALLLKAKYDEGADTVFLTNSDGSPLLGADGSQRINTTLVGNRVENTPKVTLSVAADYKLEDLVPGLSVNGAVYHVGNRALNPSNNVLVPSYTTFDLGAAYTAEVGSRQTVFRINWVNVGNTRYWASTGGDLLAQAAPSTIKFSVGTEF
ncbi:TonB-dependent siderophore receptor [Kordiimonas pumila]|uniref:TonB-dependent siderophore receptor n=1 Tax=Kordiimonas pumila TaxID=2161677 RepID=A0ABV7D7P4_9PROT|nr:TonB-dependent receptor [Kordiimonas pumila]